MNWSRAKTILIIMFLVTAAFQAFVLYTSDKKTNNISPEIIDSTVEILSANNITVSKDLIPKFNHSLPLSDADNAIYDYYQFAKTILGENTEKISDNLYSSENGTVSFDGNIFEYSASERDFSSTKNPSAETIAENFLKKIGYNISDTSKSIHKTDSGYEVYYINQLDDAPIFDSTILLKINDKYVTYAKGKWFNTTNKNGSIKLKSITAVLIDLIKSDVTKPAEITDISIGYTFPENNSFQKSVSLVPVWRFNFKNGEIISIDARNPQ